ncbi:hypothetical protein Thermo_00826 [Thermoplasmatales archaeon]|nr:hypothetical protein Thermo_00826 [Thermoplasmatales archaeon]
MANMPSLKTNEDILKKSLFASGYGDLRFFVDISRSLSNS